MPDRPPTMFAPAVSIVMAAYNEERWIAQTLRSLVGQTLAPLEIVVVDDGSTDATATLAEAAGARVLRSAHRGVGAARDAGARTAAGEIVIFLDADELYAPDFVERLVAPLADPSVRGTFPGGLEWHNADDANAAAWLRVHGFDPDRSISRGTTHPYPKALRRGDFVASGGYPHVGHGEDFAFGERTGPALVVPEARYRFTLPTATREIFAKSRWIGRGRNFERVRPPVWELVPPLMLRRSARWIARRELRAAAIQLLYDTGTAVGFVESRALPRLRNVA